MRKPIHALALGLSIAAGLAAPAVGFEAETSKPTKAAARRNSMPTAPRTVSCEEGSEGIPLRVVKGQAAFIVWPKGELNYHIALSDDAHWQVGPDPNDPEARKPQRFIPVLALTKGSVTQFHLLSNTERDCLFTATEVSSAGGPYDSTVHIAPPSGVGGAGVSYSSLQWIPKEEAKEDHDRAERLQKELDQLKASLPEQVKTGIEQFQANYPLTIRHDYEYDQKLAADYGVTGVWHTKTTLFIQGHFGRDLPVPSGWLDGKEHPFASNGSQYYKPEAQLFEIPEVPSKFFLTRSAHGKGKRLVFTERPVGQEAR